jgi:hypothetical protein
VLSLLVALISVLAVAVPILVKAFETANSNVSVRFLPVEKEDAFSILASNAGNKPAMLWSASIEITGAAPVAGWPIHIFNDPKIAEGTFDKKVIPSPNYLPLLRQNDSNPSPSCKLTVEILQFDGSIKSFSNSYPCFVTDKTGKNRSNP